MAIPVFLRKDVALFQKQLPKPSWNRIFKYQPQLIHQNELGTVFKPFAQTLLDRKVQDPNRNKQFYMLCHLQNT
jgi:hypothetical protein